MCDGRLSAVHVGGRYGRCVKFRAVFPFYLPWGWLFERRGMVVFFWSSKEVALYWNQGRSPGQRCVCVRFGNVDERLKMNDECELYCVADGIFRC